MSHNDVNANAVREHNLSCASERQRKNCFHESSATQAIAPKKDNNAYCKPPHVYASQLAKQSGAAKVLGDQNKWSNYTAHNSGKF